VSLASFGALLSLPMASFGATTADFVRRKKRSCDARPTQISQTANGFVRRRGTGFARRVGVNRRRCTVRTPQNTQTTTGFVWRRRRASARWPDSAPVSLLRSLATPPHDYQVRLIRIAKEPAGPEVPLSSSARHAETASNFQDHGQDRWPHPDRGNRKKSIGTDEDFWINSRSWHLRYRKSMVDALREDRS
jgi:hypothetical protein